VTLKQFVVQVLIVAGIALAFMIGLDAMEAAIRAILPISGQ
jgi:hypothetical protein